MLGILARSPVAHAQYAEQTGSDNPFDGVPATSTPAAIDAVMGDFDTDGDPDLLVYDGTSERFYENDGGTFTEKTGSANPFDGVSPAFSTRGRTFLRDVDGDGDTDLVTFDYTGGGTGTLVLVENTDGSTYVRQTGSDNPFDGITVSGNPATVDAVMGDFGGDDAPDLLVYDGSTERYYENDGSGSFTEKTGSSNPFDGLTQAFGTKATTLVRDFDGDGDVDLAFRDGTGGATAWQYREQTDTGFAAQTGSDNPLSTVAADATAKSVAAIAGDFDLDGHLDLLTYDNSTQRYYDGDGSGVFTEQTSGSNPFDGADPALQVAANTLSRDTDADRDVDLTSALSDANALRFVERTNAGVAFTDGRNDGNGGTDYTPPPISPGTEANPVGRFSLAALDATGASLSAVTVSFDAPAAQGIEAVELWGSDDDTFSASTDSMIAGERAFADVVSFAPFAAPIQTSDRFIFVVLDLGPGATGDVTAFLTDETALTFAGGTLAQVNGTDQSTIDQRAYLSAGSTALPVELANFEGTRADTGVRLTWTTASETGNARFNIQRRIGTSGDVANSEGETVRRSVSNGWKTVGTVDGTGTTTQSQSYRFTDTDLPYAADTLRYRLKQVDTDGTVHYANPITVTRSAVESLQLLGTYPNPARQRARVRYAIPEGAARSTVRLRLYDVMGRRVRAVEAPAEAGRHERTLDVSGLASGVYVLRLRIGATSKTQKLTVVQ